MSMRLSSKYFPIIKKRIFLLSLFSLAFLTFLILKFSFLSKAQVLHGGVRFYFEGSSQVSGETEIKIMAESGSPVAFITLRVHFDNSKIVLSKEVETSQYLKTVISKTNQNDANLNGEVVITLGLAAEDIANPPSGIFEVGRIAFVPNTSQENQQTLIYFDEGGFQVVNIEEEEMSVIHQGLELIVNFVPSPTPSFTPTPTLVEISSTPTPTSQEETETPTSTPQQSPQNFIYLSSVASVAKGDEFDLGIEIGSNQEVSGVDVIVFYDSQYLSYLSFEDKNLLNGMTIVNSNLLESTIRISQVENPGESFIGTGEVGKIRFRAEKSGNTTIRINFVPGSTNDSNLISFNTGSDILQEVNDIEISIYEKIFLQLRIKTPSSNGFNQTGTISIKESDWQKEFSTYINGESQVWELAGDFANQTKSFLVKVDGFLRKVVSTTIVSGNNIVDFGTLIAGDLNNDGIINNLDLSLMYDQWFLGGSADYNKDQIVNSADHWFLISNFFKEDE